jgi:membrane protein implicated in regulation of membrane protease activity
MESWWQGLTILNQGFFICAVFFGVLSLWQTLGALLGLGGHSHEHMDHIAHGVHAHVDAGHPAAGHHAGAAHHHTSDAADRVAFSFVSIRSVIAFGTLFSWAGALYLMGGTKPVLAIVYGFIWGIFAMCVISYLMYALLRLQETGNLRMETALGEEGTVYIDIPPAGVGQVRVMVGGLVSHVKARSTGTELLVRGTTIRVVGIDDNNVVEVAASGKGQG